MTYFTNGERLCVMSLENILNILGGDTSVAKDLGCGVSAISNWKTRGIPPGRKFDLLALAEKKEVKLTIFEIETANAAIVQSAIERGRG